MLTVGSLFSGIGMFDLGLERAGMRTLWQVELNDWCRAVLAAHFPQAERFADVRSVGAHNLARVDLICGGFPCQPISNAGKRRAQKDERWLWPEYARIVRELRPRYVLVENVAALLERGVGDVLGDLAALGYDAEWDCIPAAAVGAPHRRDRIWILAQLADPHGLGRPHPEPREHPAPAGVDALGHASPGGADDLAYPDLERLEGRGLPEHRPGHIRVHAAGNGAPLRGEGSRPERLGGREPRLVRGPDGDAGWLDGYSWPSRPGEAQHEWEAPRLIPAADKHAERRLRAVGNALVPQIPELIGRRLVERERLICQ